MSDRNKRKVVSGVVKSAKMDKTLVVTVERLTKHPQYGKFIKRHSTCYVHDEENQAGVGDHVEFMETKPQSKLKRWRLVQVTRKAVTT